MTTKEQVLEAQSIIAILPQRPPAVLIDSVIEIKPGQRILATKCISINDPAMRGHFPNLPVYPATMIIEAMLQVCTVLAYATEHYEPAEVAVALLGVNKSKFRRAVLPGDVLDLQADLTQRRSNVWRFDVTAHVDDYPVAEASLAISVLHREDMF
jgi:3-hydroxyacyl-[acyl-carrier-protein] dehydratase